MTVTTMTFQLPPELKNRLADIAKRDLKSTSQLVRDAVLVYIREYEKTHGQTAPAIA